MPVYGPRRRMPGASTLPRLQPEAKRGTLEGIGDSLAEWVETMSADVADAMMEGDQAPFGAGVSQQQQLEYYSGALFLPDGRINPAGWIAEQGRVGTQGVAEAVRQAARWRQARGLPVLLGPDPTQPVGPPGPVGQVE